MFQRLFVRGRHFGRKHDSPCGLEQVFHVLRFGGRHRHKQSRAVRLEVDAEFSDKVFAESQIAQFAYARAYSRSRHDARQGVEEKKPDKHAPDAANDGSVFGQGVRGLKVDFSGGVYNWESGEPVPRPVSVQAAVVGVMDTTVRYDQGGQVLSYTVDDAFFFSKSALDEMRAQAGISRRESNFVIRAKTPASLIDLKDELNAEGIVPLGRFELVEDLVRLDRQTARQSGSAAVVIAVLALVAALSAALLTAVSRRREYGYDPGTPPPLLS